MLKLYRDIQSKQYFFFIRIFNANNIYVYQRIQYNTCNTIQYLLLSEKSIQTWLSSIRELNTNTAHFHAALLIISLIIPEISMDVPFL